MSTDNLVRDLRDWNESDRDNHRPDQRGFCRTCSLRMPCDWANILDDVTEAADEIERLRAQVRRLDKLADDMIDRQAIQSGWDSDMWEAAKVAIEKEWPDDEAADSL